MHAEMGEMPISAPYASSDRPSLSAASMPGVRYVETSFA